MEIIIRAYSNEDLADLEKIRNDVDLQYSLLVNPKPNTRQRVLEWIEKKTADSDSVFFVSGRAELFHASLKVSLCHWCQHLPPHVFAIGRALTSMILRLCIIDSLRMETPMAADPPCAIF